MDLTIILIFCAIFIPFFFFWGYVIYVTYFKRTPVPEQLRSLVGKWNKRGSRRFTGSLITIYRSGLGSHITPHWQMAYVRADVFEDKIIFRFGPFRKTVSIETLPYEKEGETMAVFDGQEYLKIK